MELTIADGYYTKAEGAYPWQLDDVIENLNYALNYDSEHVQSLCLKGRLFMYQFKEYPAAEACFQRALFSNVTYPDTYKYYSLLKIWQCDLDKASEIIKRGKRVGGMDQGTMLLHEALILESRGSFHSAQKFMKKAKLVSLEPDKLERIEENLKRIKSKIKLSKSFFSQKENSKLEAV